RLPVRGAAGRAHRVRGSCRRARRSRCAPATRRVACLCSRTDATAAAVVAARPTRAAAKSPRLQCRAAARGGSAATAELRALFLRHVCQTSDSPMGLVVTSAAGATVRDLDGREYLDLLAGMGVANVGHAHPEVVAAVRAQAERHLHVMVYGEFVLETQVR